MPRKTKPDVAVVPLANADEEYKYEFPRSVQKFILKMRETDADLRIAFETGLVAGSTDPYFTLDSSDVWNEDDLDGLPGLTVYFASPVAGKNVEILYWTGERRSS